MIKLTLENVRSLYCFQELPSDHCYEEFLKILFTRISSKINFSLDLNEKWRKHFSPLENDVLHQIKPLNPFDNNFIW